MKREARSPKAQSPDAMTAEARAVWSGLEFRRPMMLRNIEPLSEEQMDWLPGEGRRSIRWQLWHIAEVEDNWVRRCLLDEPARFPLGVALDEAGPEDRPGKARLLEYLAEVRGLSCGRLEAMSAADFERIVRDPDFGEMPARELWAGVVTSFAWHAGQIALTAKLLPDSPVGVWSFTGWDDPSRGSAD